MLELLGMAFLLLLGSAVIAFAGGLVWLRLQVKSSFLVSALEQTLKDVPEPGLSPTLNLEWHHDLEAEELSRLYVAHGARFCGEYTIYEIENTCVRALYLESPPVFITINDHPELGCWTDLILQPEAGGTVTFSTVPEMRAESVQPHGHELIQVEASTHPDSMLGFARSRLLNQSFKCANPAEFESLADEVLQAYHKVLETADIDQAWLESIARESGVVLSGREAGIINSERQIARSDDVIHACLKSYAESSGLSASEWEQHRQNLVVIHDDIPAGSLVELLWNALQIPEALESELVSLASADGTVRMLASSFNASLPEDLRLVRIATVTVPVTADIYQIDLQPDWVRAA